MIVILLFYLCIYLDKLPVLKFRKDGVDALYPIPVYVGSDPGKYGHFDWAAFIFYQHMGAGGLVGKNTDPNTVNERSGVRFPAVTIRRSLRKAALHIASLCSSQM